MPDFTPTEEASEIVPNDSAIVQMDRSTWGFVPTGEIVMPQCPHCGEALRGNVEIANHANLVNEESIRLQEIASGLISLL